VLQSYKIIVNWTWRNENLFVIYSENVYLCKVEITKCDG
jgi:hypothetical protein